MIFEEKILNLYRGMAFGRCDDRGVAYYFSAKDFAGLSDERYDFTAAAGHTLRGHLYSYPSPIEKRIVVFDHGFGGGHLSYMKEIELLCRHGYLVFAYDHTGCMESGGESTNGMAQSLSDLNCCISALRSDARFSGYGISVMGHSWGGYSTLNISALHPDLLHVVVLSGFVSVEELVKSYFSGLLRPYRSPILALEREANPYFSTFCAPDSLRDTSAKVLLIYSDNDRMCRRRHFDILKRELSGKENVEFLLEKGKGHNPNYTADAVKYLGEYMKTMSRDMREGRLKTEEARAAFVASFDWDRMTAQDEGVWERIFRCLDS